MLIAKNRLSNKYLYPWDVIKEPEEFKDLIQNKNLICHYCGNPAFFRNPKDKICHFAHFKQNIDCPSFQDDKNLWPYRKTLYHYLIRHYDQIRLEMYLTDSPKFIDCSYESADKKIAWLIYRKGMRNWSGFRTFLTNNGYTHIHVFFADSQIEIEGEDFETPGRGMFGDLITGEYELGLSSMMNKMVQWSEIYEMKSVQIIDSNCHSIFTYNYTKNDFRKRVIYRHKSQIINLQVSEKGELYEDGSEKMGTGSPNADFAEKVEVTPSKPQPLSPTEGERIVEGVNKKYSCEPHETESESQRSDPEDPSENNQLELF